MWTSSDLTSKFDRAMLSFLLVFDSVLFVVVMYAYAKFFGGIS